jgi:hypothetical protein
LRCECWEGERERDCERTCERDGESGNVLVKGLRSAFGKLKNIAFTNDVLGGGGGGGAAAGGAGLKPPLHTHTTSSVSLLKHLRSSPTLSSLLSSLLSSAPSTPSTPSFYSYINFMLDPPIHCSVAEDEVLYIPGGWWHATVNEGEWNVFVSSFL